jgi:DNA-directed RNA polymerase specialized sigma subunit
MSEIPEAQLWLHETTVAARRERYEALFAEQDYATLVHACVELVMPDEADQEHTAMHLLPESRAHSANDLSARSGVSLLQRAYQRLYTHELSQPSDDENVRERQSRLASERNVVTMLFGDDARSVVPYSYDRLMSLVLPARQPLIAEQLRDVLYRMVRLHGMAQRMDPDELLARITPLEIGGLSVPEWPTPDSFSRLRRLRPAPEDLDVLLARASRDMQTARLIAEHFLPSLVRRTSRRDEALREDLLQSGALGLLALARRYRTRPGRSPASDISLAISRQLDVEQVLEQTGRAAPHTRAQDVDAMRRVRTVRLRMSDQLGRLASVREVAEELGTTPEDLWDDYSRGLPPMPFAEPEESWFAQADPEAESEPQPRASLEQLITLERALEFLAPGQRRMLVARYGLGGDAPLSIAEIAARDDTLYDTVKNHILTAQSELRTFYRRIEAGERFGDLRVRQFGRTVLTLFERLELPIPPDARVADMKAWVHARVEELPGMQPKHKEMMYKWYGLGGFDPMMSTEIAAEYGIKSQNLTYHESKMVDLLRQALSSEEGV